MIRRMKRTTLILNEKCMEKVRELARVENRQISEIVNDLLLEGLMRREQHKERTEFSLPSFPMGEPRVNLADRDALESVMES